MGKAEGRVRGAQVEESDGTVKAYVDKDGNLVSMDGPQQEKTSFGPTDELLVENSGEHAKLVVHDDGTITMTVHDKTETLPAKFEGFKPEARRVAALLAMTLVAMVGSGTSAPPPAAASARPSSPTASPKAH